MTEDPAPVGPGGAVDPVDPDGDHAAAERLHVPVPAWLEIGLLFVVVAVVCAGGFGLALAVVGHYSPGLSLGVGLPVAVVLTVLGARPLVGRPDVRPDRSGGQLPAIVGVLSAIVYAGWNIWRAGTWVVVDRDPGAYAVTAKWLTEHGGLVVPFQSQWGGTGLPLQGSTFGVYQEGSGSLEIQFNHLLPVLLAQAASVLGDRGILAGGAVIVALGLLVVYVVATRLTGRPWISLAAVGGLAVSLPIVYVSRATWSETVTMLLVWAGAWLLYTSWDRRSLVLAGLGGLVLGGSVMGRVDALVYLAPLPVVAGVVALVLASRRQAGRFSLMALVALVGAAVPMVVGTIDVEKRAGFYYRDLGSQVSLLQKATVAAIVVGVVAVLLAWPLRPVLGAIRTRVTRGVPALAAVLGLLTSLLVVFLWALRPALDHPRGASNPLIAGLQAAEGVPSDPTRLYSEQGVIWLSWYLGVPAVVLAVAGLGLMVHRGFRGSAAAIAVLGTTGAGSLFYLYRLSNTPDQLFGVRRFVPATLPLFAVAAAVGLGALASVVTTLLHEHRGWWRPVVAVGCAALLAFPLGTTFPIRNFSPEKGLLGAVEDVCDAVGPQGAIVIPQPGYANDVAPQTFRSWCDVPVAGVSQALTKAQIDTAAAYWAKQGRTLWVVDAVPDALHKLYGTSGVKVLGRASEFSDPTRTLTRPPNTYMPFAVTFYGAPAR